MALFSRRRDPAPDSAPVEPFRFTVERVLVVPLRGVLLTGTVTEGAVRVGQAATIAVAGEPRAVTVAGIEAKRRKRSVAVAGEEAGLYLDGITAADIPVVPGHDGSVQDNEAWRGSVVTSAS